MEPCQHEGDRTPDSNSTNSTITTTTSSSSDDPMVARFADQERFKAEKLLLENKAKALEESQRLLRDLLHQRDKQIRQLQDENAELDKERANAECRAEALAILVETVTHERDTLSAANDVTRLIPTPPTDHSKAGTSNGAAQRVMDYLWPREKERREAAMETERRERDEWAQKVAEFRKSVEGFRGSLDDALEKVKASEKLQNDRLLRLKSRLKQCMTDNAALQADLRTKNDILKQLALERDQQVREIAHAMRQMKDTRDSAAQLVKRTKENADSKIDATKKRNKDLAAEIEGLKEDKKSLTARVDKLLKAQDDHQLVVDKHKKAAEEAKTRYTSDQARIKEANEARKALAKDLAKEKTAVASLEDKFNTLREECDRRRKGWESAERDWHKKKGDMDKELARLHKELEEKSARLVTADAEVMRSKNAAKVATEDRDKTVNHVTHSTEEEVRLLRERCATLQTQVDRSLPAAPWSGAMMNETMKEMERKLERYHELTNCCACMEAPREIALGCGHLCYCQECFDKVQQQPATERMCPHCRASENLRKVFTNHRKIFIT